MSANAYGDAVNGEKKKSEITTCTNNNCVKTKSAMQKQSTLRIYNFCKTVAKQCHRNNNNNNKNPLTLKRNIFMKHEFSEWQEKRTERTNT